MILCVGDIDVDTIITVDALPTADGKVNGREVARTPGGMAANVAATIARLGGAARLFGAIGDDADGVFALDSLRGHGVDVSCVIKYIGTATFRCVVLVGPGGEKSLVRLASPAYLPDAALLTSLLFAGVTHVHTTFGSPALTLRAQALAAEVGATISLDIEAADFPAEGAPLRQAIAAADFLFCNRAGHAALEAALGAAPSAHARAVITTLGAGGSRMQMGDVVVSVPGIAVAPVDTTGAGDCFAGAFLMAHRQHAKTLRESLIFANAAASLSTLGHGAQTALPDLASVAARIKQG